MENSKVNKILIATAFPIHGAGSGVLVNLQSAYHKLFGKEVHVITANNRDDFDKQDGIKYTIVPFTSENPNKPVLPGAAPFNYLMFTTHTESTENFWNVGLKELEIYNKNFETVLKKEIEEFDPDVIHAQHNWLLSSLCTKFGKPVVTTVHGTDLIGYEKSKTYLAEINQKLENEDLTSEEKAKLEEDKQKYEYYISEAENSARNSQKIIIISDAQMDKFLKLFPFAKDHVVLAENGYDERVYCYDPSVTGRDILNHINSKVKSEIEKGNIDLGSNPEENINKFGNIPLDSDFYGLFVGKFADFKGIDALLMAMKIYSEKMREQGKVISSIIVGSGKLNENFLQLHSKLDLKDVYFMGKATPEEIHKLQEISSFKFVPSREEPFGLVAPEGVADGIPVIGANSGGIPSILKGDLKELPNENKIRTPLGMLFKTLPLRPHNIADAEREQLLKLDMYSADYIFGEPSNRDSIVEKVSKDFDISKEEAKEYLDNYEISVKNLAECAIDILTGKEVFDKQELADYISNKYGQNKKEEQILQIFEDAYNCK